MKKLEILKCMKILVYNSGGGLGDSIQLFDLIISLKEKYGQNNIFYLSAHENHLNNALMDYNVHIGDYFCNYMDIPII